MENYEENIKNIENKLDEILGGIGHKLKSFISGLGGNKYNDYDARGSNPKTPNKTYKQYVSSQGSESERKAILGKPSLYKIGQNYSKEIEDELIPLLSFEVDEEETNSRGILVHTSNEEKVLKKYPSLNWLFKSSWQAKTLGLSNVSRMSRGSIKGKLITFIGNWVSGTFMGVMKGGVISGGQIVDGYYLGGPDGFKIKPWDFKSGGSSISSGFVMGLRMAKENKNYKKLSIIQVKSDLQIKIIDNNDEEFLLKVDKGINYQSLNMKINGIEISWEEYNRSASDFEKTFIEVGKPFSIPNVVDINKGVQSIEVKSSEYESKNIQNSNTNISKNIISDKFDIKSKRKGWNPGGKGYYILDIANDEELSQKIESFKQDINSGKFFKYINFFRRLVDEGRIDGYGEYPSLAFLYPKEKGETFKNKDIERDNIMSYFSRFRQEVINNFKSDNITQYYLNLLKKEIEGENVNKNKKKSSTGLPPNILALQKKYLKENNSNLSISKIIKKIL